MRRPPCLSSLLCAVLALEMEIAGHEFFGPDGKIIWYDLQTPKSKVF